VGKPAIAVVLNGSPSKSKRYYRHFHSRLASRFDVTVYETRHRTEAIDLAARAQHQGFRYILAGGGDGTLHQVLNGIASAQPPWASLGAIPLGSGNDFNRFMGLSAEPGAWYDRVQRLETRPVDVARILCRNSSGASIEKYSINAIDTGMGPETINYVERLPRWLPTSFRYQSAILLTFLTYRLKRVTATFDGNLFEGPVRTIVVANGRSFAGGLGIGPMARPDDGRVDLFIAGRVSAVEFLKFVPSLKRMKMIVHPQLQYAQTASIELTCNEPLEIEAEGEKIGWLPAKIEVAPRALSFIC
jgi:YegS/Rv2252/BmrU family lipid kinase